MNEQDTPRRRAGAPKRLDDAKSCNLTLDAKTRDILKRLGNGKMSVGARIAASIADGPIKAPLPFDPLWAAQLLNAAAENLRSADRTESRVDGAFRAAYQLDQLAKILYDAAPTSSARAENHTTRGGPKWLPIETAPKDGRDLILLLTPSGWPQVAYSNTWWTSGFSVECTPTRWMPLPPV